MRILLLIPVVIVFIVFKFLGTNSKSEYGKWLEKELERNPDYINWLKNANSGRDYKLGLSILRESERNKNKFYNRLMRKIRG